MKKPEQLYRDAPVRNSPDSLDEKILRQAGLHAARTNDVRNRRPLLSSWMPLAAGCVVAGIGISLLLRSGIIGTGNDSQPVDGYPEVSVTAEDSVAAQDAVATQETLAAQDTFTAKDSSAADVAASAGDSGGATARMQAAPGDRVVVQQEVAQLNDLPVADSDAAGDNGFGDDSTDAGTQRRFVIAGDPERRAKRVERDFSRANELSQSDAPEDLSASTLASTPALTSASKATPPVPSPVARANPTRPESESMELDVAAKSTGAVRGTIATLTESPVVVTQPQQESAGRSVSTKVDNGTRRPTSDSETAASVNTSVNAAVNASVASETGRKSGQTSPELADSAADEIVIADVAADSVLRDAMDEPEDLSVALESISPAASIRSAPPLQLAEVVAEPADRVGNAAVVDSSDTSRAAGNGQGPRVERNSRNERIVLVGEAARNWLNEQPVSSYTLQLATADDDLYLAEFAGAINLPRGWQIVVLPVSDEPAEPRRFTLLAGVFDSYENAQSGLSELSDQARKFSARVRNIGVLQPDNK